MILDRHKEIIRTHNCDGPTAATLVLAEQLQTLVSLLANVDAVVQKIEATTPVSEPVPDQQEIVRHLAALPDVQVDLGTDGIEYIRQRYVQ